jgi:hypothetical protein
MHAHKFEQQCIILQFEHVVATCSGQKVVKLWLLGIWETNICWTQIWTLGHIFFQNVDKNEKRVKFQEKNGVRFIP